MIFRREALASGLMCLVSATANAGTMIGQYTFESTVPSGDPSPSILDAVPNEVSSDYLLYRQSGGTGYAPADLYGASAASDFLGQSGKMSVPSSGTNGFGFWLNRGILNDLAGDWSVLLWATRTTSDKVDSLFYVGTSDGFSGGSAETHVFFSGTNELWAQNRTSASSASLDMEIAGGSIETNTWYQVGLVRSGTGFDLYLDGELIGSDASTNLTSLGVSANSFIVFGGIKSTGTQGGRDRILDGLIDQIEIYDYALDQAEIRDRLDAVTVPEPASLALWTCGIFGLLAARQFRRKRDGSHPL